MGRQRGHIFLLAGQKEKVIHYGRPFSKYVKIVSDDHYEKCPRRKNQITT